MFVTEIDLLRAPGIQNRLRVSGLGVDLVLLVGPNGSGKSTLGRVLRYSLWPGRVPSDLDAVTRWRDSPESAVRTARLVFGAVQWEGDSPAVPPSSPTAWHLDVRDVLSANDADIASSIERELNGDFDLRKAGETFETSYNAPREVLKAIEAAKTARRSALRDSDDLHGREVRLGELRDALHEAATASERKARAEKARELGMARVSLRVTSDAMAALPASMDRVSEQLGGLIAGKRTDLQEAQIEVAKLEASTAGHQAEINELRLDAPPPADRVVDEWSKRAAELTRTTKELQRACAVAEGVKASQQVARRQVLRTPAGGPGLDPGHLETLDQAIDERRSARERVKDLEAERDEMARRSAGARGNDALRDAVHLLRRWLSASAPAHGAATRPSWLPVVVAGLIAAAILAATGALAVVWGQWGALPVSLLAIVMAVVLVAGGWLRAASSAQDNDERDAARRQWRQPPAPPSSWTEEAVRQRLGDLESEGDASRVAARYEHLREAAEQKLARAEAERQAAGEHVQDVCERAGLAQDFPDLLLRQQADRLRALADAEQELAKAEATRDDLQHRVDTQLAAVGEWLSEVLPATRAPADHAGAQAALETLQSRLQKLHDAEAALASDHQQLRAARARAGSARSGLDKLFRDAGMEPDDDAALHDRLGNLPAYQQHMARQAQVRSSIARLELELAEHPDLLTLCESEAAGLIRNEQALVDTLEQRSSAVSAIEQAIQTVTDGSTAEDARARLEAARDALAAARDTAIEDAAGRVVAQWLEGTISKGHIPGVLAQARKWFSRFTHSRYRIDVEIGRGFLALDTRDQVKRSLDQLSDSTRIQLLLAARLAFVEKSEAGRGALPLFLDELLGTTDPDRFREVGTCLLELVKSGRQVIYATADEDEVNAWSRVCAQAGYAPPRLARLEKLEQPERWPGDLPAQPAPPRTWPDADGRDATAYALAVGLRRPTATDPAGAWSLIHVLHDELEQAIECLRGGIETVGQLCQAHAEGLPLPLSEQALARALTRADLLKEILELRGVGRGKPLTWETITKTGLVTDAFEDAFRSALAAHRDAPEAFLEAAGAFKRFRKNKADELREHLEAGGYIDVREPLDPQAIALRAAARVSEHTQAGQLVSAEALPFVEWVGRVLAFRSRNSAPAVSA